MWRFAKVDKNYNVMPKTFDVILSEPLLRARDLSESDWRASISEQASAKGPHPYFRAPTVSLNPASLASCAALALATQVNSGALRPKCPYAAVLA
jgi:hypothetical protein